MSLTEKDYAEIREEITHCKKPLIFFHDDPDGLCSFLLMHHLNPNGKGVIIKTQPKIDEKFLRKVDEYQPDKIFVLDIALVEQEFIDAVKVPIIWVDHHGPYKRENIKYYNPRLNNHEDNWPVSYMCYKIAEPLFPEGLWIGTVGSLGDWFFPDFAKEFSKKYPQLLPSTINSADDALFKTKIGELIRLCSFTLSGSVSDSMKTVKKFISVRNPWDILEQRTPEGRYLMKRFQNINAEYEALLSQAKQEGKQDKHMFIFTYKGDNSFTKDVANRIQYEHPDKVILIARIKEGEYRMSLRARKQPIPPVLEKALTGVEGYGGGHEYACGASVKIKDFEKFLQQLREGFGFT